MMAGRLWRWASAAKRTMPARLSWSARLLGQGVGGEAWKDHRGNGGTGGGSIGGLSGRAAGTFEGAGTCFRHAAAGCSCRVTGLGMVKDDMRRGEGGRQFVL